MTQVESTTINNTKFVLILLVVALHCCTRSDLWTLDSISGSMYAYKAVRIIIGDILGTLAIPLFFFLSGYLYFYNIQEWSKDVFVRKTRSRNISLLIPYLLWNLMAAVYFIILQHHGAWSLQDLHSLRGGHFLWDIHHGSQPRPADFPLWYMRDLMVLCMLTPIIQFLNRKVKWYWIPLLWLITCVVYPIPYVTGFGFIYFTIFSLGCYWGQYKKSLVLGTPLFIVAASTSIILIVFIFLFRQASFTSWFRTLFILTGSISLIQLVYWCCQRGWLKDGLHTQSTFFIYAVHIIGIRVFCDKLFATLLPYSSQNGYLLLLRFFLAVSLTVLVSMLLYNVLQRICPRLLKILCGR